MSVVGQLNMIERVKHPVAYIGFKKLHNETTTELEEFEWWMGFRQADDAAGHFSADEISWLVETFMAIEGLDRSVADGILKEMRKSQRD